VTVNDTGNEACATTGINNIAPSNADNLNLVFIASLLLCGENHAAIAFDRVT
jgi:hypothetical protein